MATYYSDRMNAAATEPVQGGNGLIFDFAEVSVDVALVNSDVVKLFKLPKGAYVVGVYIAGHGVQSGTDAVYTVGSGDDPDRFVTVANGLNLRSNNAAQTWGIGCIPSATSGFGYKTTAETDVDLTITTAGTGMTTGGKIKAGIMYYIVD
jgi:hypothetical protein